MIEGDIYVLSPVASETPKVRLALFPLVEFQFVHSLCEQSPGETMTAANAAHLVASRDITPGEARAFTKRKRSWPPVPSTWNDKQ